MRRALGVLVVVVCAIAVGMGSAFAAVSMDGGERASAQLGTAASGQITASGLPLAQARLLPPSPAPTSAASPAAAVSSCRCKVAQRVPPPPPPPPPPAVSAPAPLGGVPATAGSVVLVSLPQQWLWVYQNQRLVYATPVTTGRPELPTPTGFFHVQWRVQNTTFYSPWPQGSPYYYAPEHVDYALYFADNGFYIHSAGWRHCFGPGTNVPHTCPDGTQETGSHGCVNTPVAAGGWLYANVPDGAAVIIRG